MTQIENEASADEIEGLFQQWQWWIFEHLPLTHVVSCAYIYFSFTNFNVRK